MGTLDLMIQGRVSPSFGFQESDLLCTQIRISTRGVRDLQLGGMLPGLGSILHLSICLLEVSELCGAAMD